MRVEPYSSQVAYQLVLDFTQLLTCDITYRMQHWTPFAYIHTSASTKEQGLCGTRTGLLIVHYLCVNVCVLGREGGGLLWCHCTQIDPFPIAWRTLTEE